MNCQKKYQVFNNSLTSIVDVWKAIRYKCKRNLYLSHPDHEDRILMIHLSHLLEICTPTHQRRFDKQAAKHHGFECLIPGVASMTL
jgi:hypothetical protein